jgi:protein arginine kinase
VSIAWLAEPAPDRDVVISGRVRLARNLLHYPFPHRASAEQLQAIAQRLRDALSAVGLTSAIELSELSLQERARLVGARVISPALLQAQAHRWALLNADGSVVAAINEEDHLRLQITCAGWQPDRLQRELIRWERTLNAMPLVWARAPKWGYLTASPINLGSGLRLGLLLHLMGLQRARQITRWLEALQALGCHTRGLYGEGSLAFEGYVQISLLGRRDPLDELLARLRGTLRTLIDAERAAREQHRSRRAGGGVERVAGDAAPRREPLAGHDAARPRGVPHARDAQRNHHATRRRRPDAVRSRRLPPA